MKNLFRLDIPKPCHENWDKMLPNEKGRFCESCAKSVIDFTAMPTAEIEAYFVQHAGKKVCGRFRNEQLDSIVISIPRENLFAQRSFHRAFLLALFVSMGTTLFSCSDADGKRQPIGRIEVIDSLIGDASAEESVTGKVITTKKKCANTVDPSVDTLDKITLGVVIPQKTPPRIKVYKDSITMSGGN